MENQVRKIAPMPLSPTEQANRPVLQDRVVQPQAAAAEGSQLTGLLQSASTPIPPQRISLSVGAQLVPHTEQPGLRIVDDTSGPFPGTCGRCVEYQLRCWRRGKVVEPCEFCAVAQEECVYPWSQ